MSAVSHLNGSHGFVRIYPVVPRLKPWRSCLGSNKTSYYFQFQVNNDNIEQSQIIQACGCLAITNPAIGSNLVGGDEIAT